MAPKKAPEKPQEEAEPEPPPPSGFSDPRFIDELIAKFAARPDEGPGDLEARLDAIVRGIAHAPEVRPSEMDDARDYEVNLRSSVLVDFWFSNLAFAQQRRWSGEKTQKFLLQMEEFRLAVCSSVDGVCDAKLALKRCLLQWQDDARKEAEQARRDAAAAAAQHTLSDGASDKETPRDTNPRAAKPAPKSAKGAAKGAPMSPPPEAPPPEPKKKEPCVFSVDDLAGVAEHCQRGLLQHHRLWHRIYHRSRSPPRFTFARGRPERARVTVWVEEAAPPARLALADGPRISFADAAVGTPVRVIPEGCTPANHYNAVIVAKDAEAVTLRWHAPDQGGPPPDAGIPPERAEGREWWERDGKPGYQFGNVPIRSRRAVAAAAEHAALCAKRRAEEDRARAEEAARRGAEEAEAARRQAEEEEERANQLTLADADKQDALSAVQQTVQGELRARQERLRERLAELESRLAADADGDPPPTAGKK